jgi:hypothetical protein
MVAVTAVPPQELARLRRLACFERLTGTLVTMSAIAIVATVNGVIALTIMIGRDLWPGRLGQSSSTFWRD